MPVTDGGNAPSGDTTEQTPGESVVSSDASDIVIVDGAESSVGSFVDIPPGQTAVSADSTAVDLPQPLIVPTGLIPKATIKNVTRPYEPKPESKQLKLETLALERVPLSISILVYTNAINWSCLSSLTILNCPNHERLWKALRRKFSPFPATSSSTIHPAGASLKHGTSTGNTHHSHHRTRGTHQHTPGHLDYKIRLKKIHTDCVTPLLIAFIKDTLPPNSLPNVHSLPSGSS